jgi:hypothetical protein
VLSFYASRTRLRVLCAAMAMLTLAACGNQSVHPVGAAGGSGSPSVQPSVSPPPGILGALSGVDPARLPNTDAGVARLLKSMPAAVAGHARTKVTRSEVHYVDGSVFTVQSLAEAAPGMAMNDFFTRFKNSGEFTVSAQNSPGAALLWLSAAGQPPYNLHFAAVAASGGKWLFGIDAVDTPAFDALVRALAATTT